MQSNLALARRPNLRPLRSDALSAKAPRLALVGENFEQLFSTHFDAIARARVHAASRGARALVVAIHGGAPVFHDVFFPGHTTLQAFVIGYSPRAHMSIASRQLGERHALLQLSLEGPAVRVRCSGLAGNVLTVENQASGRDVSSDGELFARLGDVALMVFPLRRRETAWPKSAMQAWRTLPVRVVRGGEGHVLRHTVSGGACVIAVRRTSDLIELGREASANANVTQVTATDGTDVSRVHAVIVRDAHGYTLHDTGSRHGTFVDGEQVRAIRLPKRCSIRLALGRR